MKKYFTATDFGQSKVCRLLEQNAEGHQYVGLETGNTKGLYDIWIDVVENPCFVLVNPDLAMCMTSMD